MKLKLLNKAVCENLMEYKVQDELRKKYNHDSFHFEASNFIAGEIDIDCTNDNILLFPEPNKDFESSKVIFTALKHLDLVQANDKRLWVTLTHGMFFDYTKKRWNVNEDTSEEVIKDRFHFEGFGLRARNQNSIARLWWGAKITYEESNEHNPFELTELLWEKQDLYQNLIDRKFSTYPGTLKGFLKFYSKNRHLDIKRDMRKLFKGINALGGVRILAIYNQERIIHEIEKLCIFNRIEFHSQ